MSEYINEFEYKDLEDLQYKNTVYTSYGVRHTPKSTLNTIYIHMLYIIASSQDAGEYIETIKIDGEEFLIGSDFYNENEILKSNLQNIGFEVPDAIQKAIYEVNLREESRDNIILNRKFKELLLEHVNILSNKGSYNSLINSLNWFEYGDLVKIQEYWKNTENIYYRSDLTSIIKDSLQDLLQTHIKTTYIGLYLALNKIKVDENGNILYAKPDDTRINVNGIDLYSAKLNKGLPKEDPLQDRILQIGKGKVSIEDFPINTFKDVEEKNIHKGSNWKLLEQHLIPEPIPQLEYISALFSKEELSLKMSLLGNFYATYFMPIHLDLIHSTIENIIFTDTIKISSFNNYSRTNYIHNTQSFNIYLEDKQYYLENISVSANEYTNLSTDRIWSENETIEILGVNYLKDITIGGYKQNDEIIDKSAKIYQQLYSGIGCIVPIYLKLKLEENEFIQKVNFVKEYIEDDNLKTIYKSLDLTLIPRNGLLEYQFNLLFKDSNKYSIGIELVLNNGYTYSKRFNNIKIVDNTNQDIKLYKLQKLSKYEIEKVLNNSKPNWNMFAFSTFNTTDETNYIQYITSNNSYSNIGVGITKVIRQKIYHFDNFNIFKESFNSVIEYKYSNEQNSDDIYNYFLDVRKYILNKLEAIQYGRYYYDVTIREDLTSLDTNNLDWTIQAGSGKNNIIVYLILIDKQFKFDNNSVVLKDYSNIPYIVSKNGNVWKTNFEIIQNNNGISIINLFSTLNDNVINVTPKFINNTYYFEYNDMKFEININPLELLLYDDNIPEIDYYIYDGILDKHSYFYNSLHEIKKISGNTTKTQELFLPQFHKLIELDDYKVSEQDILCVIPQFKYTKKIIDNPYWIFINNSNSTEFVTKNKDDKNISILGPYISKFEAKQLNKGYYNIKFNYQLDKTKLSIEKNNCFLLL